LSKGILSRGKRLKHSLGLWQTESDNPWHYCTKEDALYQVLEHGSYRFSRQPRSSGRPRFSTEGLLSPLPPHIHKATVSLSGRSLTLTGHAPCLRIPSDKRLSFDAFLTSLANRPGYWCLKSVQLPEDCSSFALDICTGRVIAVSDGSFSNSYGTAAWVLQGPASRCIGQVVCPGSASDQNSYRSEVSGLLAILTIVDQFVSFF
jgi:hypothetical protein